METPEFDSSAHLKKLFESRRKFGYNLVEVEEEKQEEALTKDCKFLISVQEKIT